MHLRITHRDKTKQYLLRLVHDNGSRQSINVPRGYDGEALISFPIQKLVLDPATVTFIVISEDGTQQVTDDRVGPGNWATDRYELIPD